MWKVICVVREQKEDKYHFLTLYQKVFLLKDTKRTRKDHTDKFWYSSESLNMAI